MLVHSDCLSHLSTMESNSVDAIVTDPPYGLSFMGKEWDRGVPSEVIWKECLRVLKPGGHLLAFAGTRTQHRMATAIEDAGFEIRDMIAWVYGCLSSDTEVLVDGEWQSYDKAVVGSHVLCYIKEHDRYEWQPVQDFVEYDYCDTAYHICSDRTDQIVSRNHRCLVKRDGEYIFSFAETLESEEIVPILESVQEITQGQGYTLADLARVKPIHYTGKVWCLRVPSGAFVARRNGKIFVTGNSGFPKSLDISKAIDKSLGVEREVVGTRTSAYGTDTATGEHISRDKGGPGLWGGPDAKKVSLRSTAAATDAAKEWAGFGSALKPSLEPVTVARKPLDGTLVQNVLRHGVGGLNIDGCRVASEDWNADMVLGKYRGSNVGKSTSVTNSFGVGEIKCTSPESTLKGRWPANLILDESDEVRSLFPDTGGGTFQKSKRSRKGFKLSGSAGNIQEANAPDNYGDSGSAARFFYCAKASTSERNLGCEHLIKTDEEGNTTQGNTHPTVKPVDLMRYLVRLVCPPGGLVLDPFMGSGTTGVACVYEGMEFIGIEKEQAYIEIVEARMKAAHDPKQPAKKSTKKHAKNEDPDPGMGPLFSKE